MTLGNTEYAFADSTRSHQWILSDLQIAKAHQYSSGKGVVVGLVDSGVDATHPDLIGSISGGIDLSDPSIVGKSSNGENDSYGHGTGMAGLIVGHGHGPNNNDGIVGIAPSAKILSARTGIAISTATTLAAGLNWVVAHGAEVVCIAQGSSVQDDAEKLAIQNAQVHDVVVVAAVGNEPEASSVSFPAAYSGVLAAAGTGEDGLHAAISVTGPQVVLSAPAIHIYSTGLGHGYSVGDGTSYSTAIIAGAAALVRARFPKLSAVEVIHRLTATATDLGPPGRDDEYGYGELNLVAALTANVPPLTTTITPRPIDTATLPPTTATTPASTAATTATAAPPTSSTSWLPLAIAIAVVLAIVILLLAARRARASRSP